MTTIKPMIPPTMTNAFLIKKVLDVSVYVDKISNHRYLVIVAVPHYHGTCYWWCTSEQEARDIFDCINEDKVFFLQQARTPHAMAKTRSLVGTAICRRIGLMNNTQ